MLGAFIGIMVYFLFSGKLNYSLLQISTNDWILITILSVVCTAVTFVLSVDIMKEISPYTVVLTVNLEPIYGIVFAYFILNEGDKLNWKFYVAATFILAVVFLNTWLKSGGRVTISLLLCSIKEGKTVAKIPITAPIIIMYVNAIPKLLGIFNL